MNKKKKIMIISILLITVLMFSACGNGNNAEGGEDTPANTDETEKITLIAAHTAPPEHPYQDGFEKMNEVLKEKSDGQMEIEIHHSSSLGEEADFLEGLQMGTIDFTTVSPAPLTGFVKDYLVCDLPFTFQEIDEAYDFYDGEFGDLLFEKSESVGFVGLAWWDNGFRNFTNSKRPITTPEDMKGLKIRTMSSQVHMASVNALGASATPIPFGELYSALQQGVVDGQENPVALIHDNRLFEVQDYVTLSRHFYDPSPTFMSKVNFDKLSEQQQQWIIEAAIAGRDEMRKLLNEQEADKIATIKEAGVQVSELTKEQFAAFQDATKDIYKEFEDDIDGEIMKSYKVYMGLE